MLQIFKKKFLKKFFTFFSVLPSNREPAPGRQRVQWFQHPTGLCGRGRRPAVPRPAALHWQHPADRGRAGPVPRRQRHGAAGRPGIRALLPPLHAPLRPAEARRHVQPPPRLHLVGRGPGRSVSGSAPTTLDASYLVLSLSAAFSRIVLIGPESIALSDIAARCLLAEKTLSPLAATLGSGGWLTHWLFCSYIWFNYVHYIGIYVDRLWWDYWHFCCYIGKWLMTAPYLKALEMTLHCHSLETASHTQCSCYWSRARDIERQKNSWNS